MFLRVETSSGVPITRQIADQIRSYSVSGVLAPGDRLPSVRQLAKELAVNQNTILHVYERLTAEGLLERKQGDGTYVSQNLLPGRAKAQRELLAADLDRLAHRAADLNIGPEDLHQLLDAAVTRVEKVRGTAKKPSQNAKREN
jgi:GntR family transcriptional regulator